MHDHVGGERVAAAALALVGVPFRLQGRDPASGLDCVGLASLALRLAGHRVEAPGRYDLRNGNIARLHDGLTAAGLVRVDAPMAGDIVLARVGPLQLHLMIVVEGGFVHAHAGLRKVVMMPGASPWPLAGCWRARLPE